MKPGDVVTFLAGEVVSHCAIIDSSSVTYRTLAERLEKDPGIEARVVGVVAEDPWVDLVLENGFECECPAVYLEKIGEC